MNLGSTLHKTSNLRDPATKMENSISSLIPVSSIKKKTPEFYFPKKW